VIVRIVYLHQYFNTPDMAGGTRSFEMARRLVARGHQVDLVTSSRDRGREGGWYTTVEAGIRVHWLPVPYDNKMSFGQRLRAFLRFAVAASRRAASLPADVVFATSTPLTIVFPGIYSAWRRRVPLVFEVRDLWPDVPIAMGVIRNPVAIWLARALERLAYRYSKHIVALAPGMRVDILGKGVAAHKVSVIPNGCDRGVFGVDHASAVAALRASRDWLGQRRLVLFGGTLGLANGVGYLVSIAEAMRRLDPEIRFVVIGDGAERAAIAELARHKGVLDQTFFMPGAMPKRELAVWLAACDMAVGLFSGPRVLWKDAAFRPRALGARRAVDADQQASTRSAVANEVVSLPVKVSATAQQMMQAARLATDGKESFDAKKVERLRREIMEGRFPIDEERLARKVMELEQQLGDLGRE
jgi:flagellar biosynthesis anti-sigma factor FlgM